MLKRRSLVLTAILLLGVLVPGIGAETPPAHAAAADQIVCPTDGTPQGVDVNGSVNPLPIDWSRVAGPQSGRKFGYVQANDGNTPDTFYFTTNFNNYEGSGGARR